MLGCHIHKQSQKGGGRRKKFHSFSSSVTRKYWVPFLFDHLCMAKEISIFLVLFFNC